MQNHNVDTKSEPCPPLLSYKSWSNFNDSFREKGVPSHIDRTLMGSQSGGTQTALLATYRFFHLIEEDGSKTPQLDALVAATGDERKAILRGLAENYYPYFFRNGFDLAATTPKQVDDQFKQFSESSDTRRRCMTFFLGLAEDAGIKLSSHIKIKVRNRPGGTARKTAKRTPAKPAAPKAQDGEQGGARAGEQNDVQHDFPAMTSDMLRGLFKKLPKPGEVWAMNEREQWKNTITEVFKMEYKEDNEEE